MQFFPIRRDPDDFQQGLTPHQIQALCERAFGSAPVESARELGGGEHNNVYLVHIAKREPVILRVAPSAQRITPGREVYSLRQEHAILPYLAALGPLLPKTLAIDFTGQVLPRDYLFQTYMSGERWFDVAKDLTQAQDDALWRALASQARTISTVEGSAFGHPHPGRQYPSWSATMLAWLERTSRDAERAEVDAGAIWAIREIAAARADLLDEITTPRLCPGDLWTFNVLIDCSAELPTITAVLDNDGYYWGDPMASWTMHLLPRRATPHVQQVFWEVYGKPEETLGMRFRALVYDGMHQGNALAHTARRGPAELFPRVRAMQAQTLAELRELVG